MTVRPGGVVSGLVAEVVGLVVAGDVVVGGDVVGVGGAMLGVVVEGASILVAWVVDEVVVSSVDGDPEQAAATKTVTTAIKVLQVINNPFGDMR